MVDQRIFCYQLLVLVGLDRLDKQDGHNDSAGFLQVPLILRQATGIGSVWLWDAHQPEISEFLAYILRLFQNNVVVRQEYGLINRVLFNLDSADHHDLFGQRPALHEPLPVVKDFFLKQRVLGVHLLCLGDILLV